VHNPLRQIPSADLVRPELHDSSAEQAAARKRKKTVRGLVYIVLVVGDGVSREGRIGYA